MKITNNSSDKIICLIHEAKKKVFVEPFSFREFPFYKGIYLIASMYDQNSLEVHKIWETLEIVCDGEIIVGFSQKKRSGTITTISSGEISTILFRNNGKTPLEVFWGEKYLHTILPLRDCLSRGYDSAGFRVGDQITIKDSNQIIDRIMIDDKWISRIDLGLVAFKKFSERV